MGTRVDAGLAGVIVADTALSEVDGARGQLVLRGHRLSELAGRVEVEAVAALLWDLPEADAAAILATGRTAAWACRPTTATADGMDALRASLAALPADVPPAGAPATLVAAWTRLIRGLEPIAPDPDLPHATDFVRMVTGESAPAALDALRTYLVTVADHGLNASTFAARVVASTGSDDTSALVAAVGALKGPLHGGAPGPVLDMLDAVGEPERADAWLRGELAAGRRIMGMGHRVYRVRDPRAAVLEAAVERIAASRATPRLTLARAVEQAAARLLAERHPDRALRANVEFYTAVLLEAAGWDRRWFAPTFAVGRAIGWAAHVREQRATGRLIRPASNYVGPRPRPGAPAPQRTQSPEAK